MNRRKRIAIVLQRATKGDVLAWIRVHRAELDLHELYAVGCSMSGLEQDLGIEIQPLDQGEVVRWAVSSMKGDLPRIDMVICFWNGPQDLPRTPGLRALMQLAVRWNLPLACNRASADVMVASLPMPHDMDARLPAAS